jgi:hypothetical protein
VRGVKLAVEVTDALRSILAPGGRLLLFSSAEELEIPESFQVLESRVLSEPLGGALIVLAKGD